jgi:hypothetical protein
VPLLQLLHPLDERLVFGTVRAAGTRAEPGPLGSRTAGKAGLIRPTGATRACSGRPTGGTAGPGVIGRRTGFLSESLGKGLD